MVSERIYYHGFERVEAMQFTGENADTVRDFLDPDGIFGCRHGRAQHNYHATAWRWSDKFAHAWRDRVYAHPGQWLVKFRKPSDSPYLHPESPPWRVAAQDGEPVYVTRTFWMGQTYADDIERWYADEVDVRLMWDEDEGPLGVRHELSNDWQTAWEPTS